MKKIILCVDLNLKYDEIFSNINNLVDLKGKSVEFVHSWDDGNYPYPGELIVAYYPNKDQANKIEDELKAKLSTLASELSKKYECESKVTVLRGSSAKREISDYIDKAKPDCAITVIPKRSGVDSLFHSSFTQYIQTHTTCPTLSMKVK